MDIRSWSLNQIMQLPDWCFGDRFVISNALYETGEGYYYDVSAQRFPERSVIWEIGVTKYTAYGKDLRVALLPGNKTPTSQAEFNELEELIPGFGLVRTGPRSWMKDGYPAGWRIDLRYPRYTNGCRLCTELKIETIHTVDLALHCVVSMIPTEVPDWLVKRNEQS